MKQLIIAATATVLAGFFSIQANAFCVYNKSDKPARFQQVEMWKGMTTLIKPGDKACCNWKEKDCNPSKKQNATLKAILGAGDDSKKHSSYAKGENCGVFKQGDGASLKHEAGGYLVIENYSKYDAKKDKDSKNPTYFVTSYSADHAVKARYTCPPTYEKMGVKDFLPGVGDIFEAILAP